MWVWVCNVDNYWCSRRRHGLTGITMMMTTQNLNVPLRWDADVNTNERLVRPGPGKWLRSHLDGMCNGPFTGGILTLPPVSSTFHFTANMLRSLCVHIGLNILHGEERCGLFRPVVCGKEPCLIGAVPTSEPSWQVRIQMDGVSMMLAGVGMTTNNSCVEELKGNDWPLVVLAYKDTVVALDPSKRPFTQWYVEAELWVPTDPMLYDVSSGLLLCTTHPIRAESWDVWDDKTRLWNRVWWVSAASVCASISMLWHWCIVIWVAHLISKACDWCEFGRLTSCWSILWVGCRGNWDGCQGLWVDFSNKAGTTGCWYPVVSSAGCCGPTMSMLQPGVTVRWSHDWRTTLMSSQMMPVTLSMFALSPWTLVMTEIWSECISSVDTTQMSAPSPIRDLFAFLEVGANASL